MHRPAGVTRLAILSFLNALNMLLAGLVLIGASFIPQTATVVFYLLSIIAGCGSRALGALMLQISPNLFFIAELLIAVLYAAIGFGLLKFQNWARWLIIALCTVELIMAGVGYTVSRFLVLRVGIVGMAIDVAALIFLFQPKVKEIFEAGAN